MPRDINLGPTGGPFVTLQENNGDLDISNATNVDLNGANLTNANVGGFDSVEVFEADGTFDASNVDTVFVECVGGGGGSHGLPPNKESGFAGDGGGGGAYAANYVDVSATSSVSITVGNGGVAGSGGDPPTDGGDGSSSSFGSDVSAPGGSGSTFSEFFNRTGGDGGGFGVGAITVPGQDGGAGTGNAISTELYCRSGSGGGNVYAPGGDSRVYKVPNDELFAADVTPGRGPGAGANGPITMGTGDPFPGGAGRDGIVVVYYKA